MPSYLVFPGGRLLQWPRPRAWIIIMGTHGRTGFEQPFLGSVAERVVRLAPCPVLVTPSPQCPRHRGRQNHDREDASDLDQPCKHWKTAVYSNILMLSTVRR